MRFEHGRPKAVLWVCVLYLGRRFIHGLAAKVIFSLTIKVRQKQYGIVRKSEGQDQSLETKDIKTCTGLVGVHPNKEIAFMAHFDTPKSVVRVLNALDEDLGRQGYRFSDFQLSKVSGISRLVIYGPLVLLCPLIQCTAWLNGYGFLYWLWIASLALWSLSGVTRCTLIWQLWRLKASTLLPRFIRSEKKCNPLRGCNLKFDLASMLLPKVSMADVDRDPDFDVDKNGQLKAK